MWLARKRISDVATQLPLPELVKRTRIVVIDDEETEFPFKILRDFGYAIDYWPDVQDLTKLERGHYDIIILDIGGVGRELDEESEGVGVLKHIKQVNPMQIVVAYSGQSHEIQKIPFFRLADQYVPKPTNAMTWKETLDDLIRTRLTAAAYWSDLTRMLADQGVTNKQIRKLEKQIIGASKKGATDGRAIASGALGTVDNIASIAGTIGKILALFA